jgi:hypothetical protein
MLLHGRAAVATEKEPLYLLKRGVSGRYGVERPLALAGNRATHNPPHSDSKRVPQCRNFETSGSHVSGVGSGFS